MLMTPGLQARHFDYVLGPNQDSRLASVASGANITGIVLQLDTDAPFVLTGRAVRCSYGTDTGTFGQGAGLVGLRTRWSGPNRDYRQQSQKAAYVLESLQSAWFGQRGNPKPIVPPVMYPAGSVLMVDLKQYTTNPYSGLGTAFPIINLTFFFRGYKLYPEGTVTAYTYPKRMASQTFAYPVPVTSLGINEIRRNQIFIVKPDADFGLRGGQSFVPSPGSLKLAEVGIILRDFNKQPYSSDFMPLDVLFGSSPNDSSYSLGGNEATVATGTGPRVPGLFYPEIYVPKNHQLLYDIQRQDGTLLSATEAATFKFNLIGGKVFDK